MGYRRSRRSWRSCGEQVPQYSARVSAQARYCHRISTGRSATRPGARFRRLARRFGKGNEKKAAIAVAHTLMSIAWAVIRYDSDYTDYYERRDQSNREHLVRYHQNALARLGLQVIITQPGDSAPPPPHNPGQAA